MSTIYRGHGLNDNDVAPNIAQPSGEGIANIYTALRMGDSCFRRGFFLNNNECTGKKFRDQIVMSEKDQDSVV